MQNLHSWLMYQVHGVRLPRRRRKPRRGPDQAEAYRDWIRQQPSCVSESTRDVEVIIEGLFTEWSEIQARRFGQNASVAERKLVATATLDRA